MLGGEVSLLIEITVASFAIRVNDSILKKELGHNEIPLHIHQDGYKQNTKTRKYQELATMWRNWNTCVMLEGMENGKQYSSSSKN